MEKNNITKTLTAGLMYGLKVESSDGIYSHTHEIGIHNVLSIFHHCKPYLFPMSALTKEIEFKGERFVPIDKMSEELKLNTIEYCWIAANIHQPAFPMKDLRASVVEWMQKHMFNVEQLSPEEFIEVNETNNPYK